MNIETALELIAAYSPKVHAILAADRRYPTGENARKVIRVLLDDAAFWVERRPGVAKALLDVAREIEARTDVMRDGRWMRAD